MKAKELETLIAEKVMGWCKHDYEVSWMTSNNIKSPSGALCKKCNERLPLPIGDINLRFHDYHPLTDKNQCFDALEAFLVHNIECKGYDTERNGSSMRCIIYIGHFKFIVGQSNKSLNAAICLALAEAITGTKQTLEV